MYCRKDFMDLTADERTRLAAALNQIHADGVIEHHAHHHDHYFSNGIHRGPAFLPWHRHMLLLIEQALRLVDARVTLPYWDWTRSDSRNLDAEPWKSFFGGRTNSGGQFDHWDYTRGASDSGSLPSLDSVISEVQAGSYTAFRAMEFGSHVPGHTWTGGTMNSTRSPADPLFYLHHGNVDRLWAIWQRNHAALPQYSLDNCSGCSQISSTFVPLNDPMVGGATPASMLDHLALGTLPPRSADGRSRRRVGTAAHCLRRHGFVHAPDTGNHLQRRSRRGHNPTGSTLRDCRLRTVDLSRHQSAGRALFAVYARALSSSCRTVTHRASSDLGDVHGTGSQHDGHGIGQHRG